MTLVSCDKPEPEVRPLPTPEPTPTATPTPVPQPDITPQATPEPPPQARLAPEGVFYVIKSFSVTTDSEIYGFRKGTKVSLVREVGSDYIVTNGQVEGIAPRESFSNDLDLVEKIVQDHHETQTAAAAARSKSFLESQAKAEENEKQRQENVRLARIEKLQNQLKQLDAKIAAASQSLQEVYQAKARGGYVYDADGRKVGARASSASGSKFQLEQSIAEWKRQREAIQNELK